MSLAATKSMPSAIHPPPLTANISFGQYSGLPEGNSETLSQLRQLQADHSFWHNPLLKAFWAGHLSLEDMRFVFGQYSFYSRGFTRLLAAYIANTDNDLHRAQLMQNLWEESGESNLDQRHAELFRQFLTQGLGVAVEQLSPIPATQSFINELLSFCLRSPACESVALLSLGTEGIVPRLYAIFVRGLKRAGVAEQHLHFFHLHIACDDDHALTLEKILVSYASEPHWFDACRRTLTFALDLREQFFTALYEQIQRRRIQPILEGIQQGQSLTASCPVLRYQAEQPGKFLYCNRSCQGKSSIDFSVERLALPSTVLDPRLVYVSPHKTNERHRHAHEALFVIKQGQGTVWIDQMPIEVAVGDTVFVPRWAVHQIANTGDRLLIVLAITDFGLTRHAFVGNYLSTARMHVAQDADFAELNPLKTGDDHDSL